MPHLMVGAALIDDELEPASILLLLSRLNMA